MFRHENRDQFKVSTFQLRLYLPIFNTFKFKELPKLGVGLYVFHMMDSISSVVLPQKCASAQINRVMIFLQTIFVFILKLMTDMLFVIWTPERSYENQPHTYYSNLTFPSNFCQNYPGKN